MVDRKIAETGSTAQYSLSGLHRLAGFKQVNYASRRVQRHVANLEYGLDDVCARLCELRQSHFHRAERYEGSARWYDVYLLPHPVPANVDERLYIKFRVTDDCVWIELCSFHPEGWT